MSGEIISTSAAAIGVAGYLAGEVFKPALQSVGESIRGFLTTRVQKVLARAEQKIPKTLKRPLEPGFFVLFVQRAACSDDSEELTEMWANLLADAAKDYSNRHLNYVEILSQLGPYEVSVLNDIAGEKLKTNERAYLTRNSRLRRALLDRLEGQEVSASKASKIAMRLSATQFDWPGLVARVEIQTPNRHPSVAGKGEFYSIHLDILLRQRLLEEIVFDLPADLPVQVRALVVTSLGNDFLRACRGKNSG